MKSIEEINKAVEERKAEALNLLGSVKVLTHDIEEKLKAEGHIISDEVVYTPETDGCSLLDSCSITPENVEVSTLILKDGIEVKPGDFDNVHLIDNPIPFDVFKVIELQKEIEEEIKKEIQDAHRS